MIRLVADKYLMSNLRETDSDYKHLLANNSFIRKFAADEASSNLLNRFWKSIYEGFAGSITSDPHGRSAILSGLGVSLLTLLYRLLRGNFDFKVDLPQILTYGLAGALGGYGISWGLERSGFRPEILGLTWKKITNQATPQEQARLTPEVSQAAREARRAYREYVDFMVSSGVSPKNIPSLESLADKFWDKTRKNSTDSSANDDVAHFQNNLQQIKKTFAEFRGLGGK